MCTAQSSPTVNTSLNDNEIASAREERLKNMLMWSILRQFISYALFLSLISILTFSGREPNSFFQVNHLRKYFGNQRQVDCDYAQVRDITFVECSTSIVFSCISSLR
jgi:hypothetical protein